MKTEVFLGQQYVVAGGPMERVLEIAKRAALTDAAVLITGESGSGKELVARAVHHHSRRSNKPWVDVNAGAFPEHLVESELFGFEKGAFSGASVSKPGLLELANTGVFFLDEIGELDARLQVKLLRVLDGAPYYRLGGTRKIAVDVRIIAATNKDLKSEVAAGRFRADLYYRLNQIQVDVPPLRERPECVRALSQFFLIKHAPEFRLSPAVLDLFQNYSWPGNIRELRNAITRAAISATHGEIRIEDLPREMISAVSTVCMPTPAVTKSGNLEELEKAMIIQALNRTRGHQGKAAEILGISRRTIYRKLKLLDACDAASLSAGAATAFEELPSIRD